MARELIITMAAANRAGILAAVTKAMSELGGDLREASQTVVRGYFTMIFSAEFPDQIDQTLIRDHLRMRVAHLALNWGSAMPRSPCRLTTPPPGTRGPFACASGEEISPALCCV